ncbi:MAG: hypothetical protein GY835_08000 [bacterium]|nr:hypothetical protein [bacterium]
MSEGGKGSGQNYSRFPEVTWERWQFRQLPDKAKLLFTLIITGPFNRPRSLGLYSGGPGQLLDVLGEGWSLQDIEEGFDDLEKVGLVQRDRGARLIWVSAAYFKANSKDWFMARVRGLLSLPPCPLRDMIITNVLVDARRTHSASWFDLDSQARRFCEDILDDLPQQAREVLNAPLEMLQCSGEGGRLGAAEDVKSHVATHPNRSGGRNERRGESIHTNNDFFNAGDIARNLVKRRSG